MTECELCNNREATREKLESEMCDSCWQDYHAFRCVVCEELKDRGTLDAEMNRYVVITGEFAVEKGIYRVLEDGFIYGDGLNRWLDKEKVEKVTDIHKEGIVIQDRHKPIGYVCFDCILDIPESDEIWNKGCMWCGRKVTLMDGRFCNICMSKDEFPEELKPE